MTMSSPLRTCWMVSRAAIETCEYALVHVKPSKTSSLRSILSIALHKVLYHVNDLIEGMQKTSHGAHLRFTCSIPSRLCLWRTPTCSLEWIRGSDRQPAQISQPHIHLTRTNPSTAQVSHYASLAAKRARCLTWWQIGQVGITASWPYSPWRLDDALQVSLFREESGRHWNSLEK